MNADADLLFHPRKRHLPAADHHHHYHGPQRKRRFFSSPLFARQPLPPEARSAAFDMGNFLSALPGGCMPRDGGLGLFRDWVGASKNARGLTVVTEDNPELGHVVMSGRVVDWRKVPLQAAAPPREKRKPHYKEALERVGLHDKRLAEIGVEVRLQEKTLDELRKVVPKEDLSLLFIPLTAEEDNEVHECLYGRGSSSEVLVLHESSNIEVTREKFRCLRPHGWLNDEVINLYLELLKERGIREPKRFLKCHFFNTFFYKKLACGKSGYDYKSVKRWTTCRKLGYELIECDKVKWMLHSLKKFRCYYPSSLTCLFLMFNLCSEFTLQIFVPVHKDVHWCLAIINMKKKTLQYLDSLGGNDRHVQRVLAKYIVEEVKDKSNKEIDISSWKEESVDYIPLQENGWDCGMFMLKYIDFHSRGLSLSFSQVSKLDMPNLSRRSTLLASTLPVGLGPVLGQGVYGDDCSASAHKLVLSHGVISSLSRGDYMV